MQITRQYYPIEDAAKMAGGTVEDLLHLGANWRLDIWVAFDRDVRAWVEKPSDSNHEPVLETLHVGLFQLNPIDLEYLECGRKDWLSVVHLKNTAYRLIKDGKDVAPSKMFVMTTDIERLQRQGTPPPQSNKTPCTESQPGGGETVTLPHLTQALRAVFQVMWENWDAPDPKRLPKQINIARELDAALGYKPEKDGSPSRNAKAIAALIKPDAIKD